MHELSITRNIVAIAADAARGRKVLGVTLAIGKRSGVLADAVAFCFDTVVEGTALEGAKLHIIESEARATCQECGTAFAVADLVAICACGSRSVQCEGGDELLVKSIEIEEAA
jgi:hydrogenase nickel incorporation protein HypA/HybF